MNRKIATKEQMLEIEKKAIEKANTSVSYLMESAGNAICREVENAVGNVSGKKIIILCGNGKNGGDGFSAARQLFYKGAYTKALFFGEAENLPEVTKSVYERLPKDVAAKEISYRHIEEADIIIDAVFGTGFHGALERAFEELFAAVNNSKAVKFAVDIPSGIECNTGVLGGKCIKCDYTITFALPKPCHYLFPAADYCGKIIVADISIPQEIIDLQKLDIFLSDMPDIVERIPSRKRNTHKGDYGRLLEICGSEYMTGAAYFCANGALKSGVGLLNMLLPEKILPVMQIKVSEAVFSSYTNENIKEKLEQQLEKSNACVFGCGSGQAKTSLEILEYLLKSDIPLVLDADALNVASLNKISLKRSKATVITPHMAEFSRLTGLSIEEIEKDKIGIVREFCQKENVITVLKGAYTIIAEPNGQVCINYLGNSGMAKGGSGDVLAGIIASLLAQGLDGFDSALCAAYIHSAAGDSAAQKLSQYSMTPTDIINELPLIFKAVELEKANG
ncbi:MAG: NAD(P)H-hydrate dehydratase [Ruminococcaceae bacterium]|nr:NAD(P)H-hydrate dehydratase [Oscillospiraceae bacterium]